MNGRRIVMVACLAAFSLVVSLSGCASPSVYQLQSGERSAGAEGEMTVTTDGNGNQVIDLQVAHLPRPSQLSEQMAIYTVWIRPADGGQYYNVGRLRLADDRTGSLNFVTPFSAYDLLVTAEAKPTEMSPSDQVVLRREVASSRNR